MPRRKTNEQIVAQRNRIQVDALNAYNSNDPTRRSQRRYAQANNAAVSLLLRNGVPRSEFGDEPWARTDMVTGRNVASRTRPRGLNVALANSNG